MGASAHHSQQDRDVYAAEYDTIHPYGTEEDLTLRKKPYITVMKIAVVTYMSFNHRTPYSRTKGATTDFIN